MLLIHAARGERLTNGAAREILSTDSVQARNALKRLRDLELLVQEGERGGATYLIAPDLMPAARYRLSEAEIESLILSAAHDEWISNSDVRELTGLDRAESLHLLRRLVRKGLLEVRGERRGTRYRAV
jgi:ATP-dependent DNA helicase RecG